MRELLISLVPWGVDVIVALQAASGHALDPLFRTITWLGDSTIYLSLLPLALWYGDKSRGTRLALLLLLSLYLNLLLKQVFAIPRPFVVSTAIEAKDNATSYAFPSGHAQGATTLWLGLAMIYGRPGTLVIGAILIALVSFSRVYLGVHYPQDAIGGILLGLGVVGAFRFAETPWGAWWRRQSVPVRVAICVLAPLAMAALTPNTHTHAVAGAILGISLGHTVETTWRGRRLPSGGPALLLRALVALAVVGTLYVVVTLTLSIAATGGIAGPAVISLGQAALVGLTVSLGVPWLIGRVTPRDHLP